VNITGLSQYSKATVGIKDPTKLLNQQQKLIFVYPILTCDKIKVSNIKSFETTIRDFISVTFLSDIFTENALNIVSMANQVAPLWDENRQAVDPTSVIAKTLNPQGTYEKVPSQTYPIGKEYSHEIQRKINEKTAIIQQLTKTDPRFVKLRPYIEIITLGNLIDVPVIVGTQAYPVDTLSIMYVLIAAIGLNKKLNKMSDVNDVFNELEKMTPEKYWSLLKNLFGSKETAVAESRSLISRLFGTISHTRLGKYINKSTRIPIRNIQDIRKRSKEWKEKEVFEEVPDIFLSLSLKQQDLDKTKIFFKFVLNRDLAERKFGVDTSDETLKMSNIVTHDLNTDLNNITNNFIARFEEFTRSYIFAFIHDIHNILYVDDQPTDFSISDITNKYFNKQFYESLQKSVEGVFKLVSDSLRNNNISVSRNSFKILKESICSLKFVYINEFLEKALSIRITTMDYDKKQLLEFINYIKNFGETGNDLVDEFIDAFEKFARNGQPVLRDFNFGMHVNNIRTTISEKVKRVFTEIRNIINVSEVYPRIDIVLGERKLNSLRSKTDDRDDDYYKRANNIKHAKDEVLNNTLPLLQRNIENIMLFLFYSQLQEQICKNINSLDIKLETVSHEVTSWPNYTLVLPVEIVTALYAAISGLNWRNMLKEDIKNERQRKEAEKEAMARKHDGENVSTPTKPEHIRTSYLVSENYIKGIMKFISNRLNVPNLITVDGKKGDIYCKLMNQTDINKFKISTLDTFVQSKLNRSISM